MKTKIILFVILFSSISLFGQFKFGTDIYSRYIWRGLNLGGDAPSLQPGLSYSISGFTAGLWGAYSSPGSGTTYSEIDIYASYTLATESAGAFSLIFTDYYIPSLGIPFGHFQKEGGAHVIEGGLSYSGPSSFPILLSGFYNIHNDPDNSAYIQLGYLFTVDDVSLTPAIGFVPSESVYYVTDEAAIINVSLSASKAIQITEKFSVPITVAFINNPKLDISYLVFGASFTL